MTYRVRNIGIAVALAVVAALLTSFYVTNYKRHVQRGEDHVTVLVAKHDIPVGTAGSDAKGMISTAQVPRRSVVPGSISSPDEIKSLVASQRPSRANRSPLSASPPSRKPGSKAS